MLEKLKYSMADLLCNYAKFGCVKVASLCDVDPDTWSAGKRGGCCPKGVIMQDIWGQTVSPHKMSKTDSRMQPIVAGQAC